MMRMWGRIALMVIIVLVFPLIGFGQTVADKIHSLHSVLDVLHKEMIVLCEGLIDLGRGLAGFGALWYISVRVWRHIANSEPIDFYPLFRPFVLGFCIAFFPLVLGLIQGLLQPTVEATGKLVKDSDKAVKILLKQREVAVLNSNAWQMYVGQNKEGDKEKWLRYTQGIQDGQPTPEEGFWNGFGNDIKFAMAKASYNFRSSVKEWISEILQLLFQAASLCINALRTFQLVVLGILGPIVFGIAVFDGFQQSLTAWLSKYVNIFLWLPVCNIFGAILGKIQERMLALDLDKIANTGDAVFGPQDTGYLIFMIIGIVGYFTVPSVANFIVNAGGGGAMLQKMTSMVASAPGAASAVAGRAGSGLDNIADARKHFNEGYSGKNTGSGAAGAIGQGLGAGGAYMAQQLAGEDKGSSANASGSNSNAGKVQVSGLAGKMKG